MKALLEKKPRLTISNYGHLELYKRKEDRDRLVKLLRNAGVTPRSPDDLKHPEPPHAPIVGQPELH